ncbi:MAG: sodium:solute symporter, partial [Rikenellaceae bacterium]|nr:sodium:solute symporter [Rikenellaceae bacterium]
FISKKAKNPHAVAGVIVGVLVIAWMSLSPFVFDGDLIRFRSEFHMNLTIVFGTTAIFLTGFLLSLIPGAKKTKIP